MLLKTALLDDFLLFMQQLIDQLTVIRYVPQENKKAQSFMFMDFIIKRILVALKSTITQNHPRGNI